MTTLSAERSDPVGDRYYATVKNADHASDLLFYLTAFFSIAVLFIDQAAHPIWTHVVKAAFVLSVISLFSISLATRLHLSPRAEAKRRLDFFTNSLQVSMTHESSVGYFNNEETDPDRKMAAQLLENCHFTKSIAQKMVPFELTRVALYVVLWCICWLQLNVKIDLIAVATQVIFTEQIVSRAFRVFWLRLECEKIFDEVRDSFASGSSGNRFRAATLRSFTNYEAIKAIAGITLSSKTFDRENAKLSEEWEEIKKTIGL